MTKTTIIWLFLLLLFILNPIVSGITPEDERAFEELKSQISPNIPEGWLTNETEICSFERISCLGGSIIYLDLSGLNLDHVPDAVTEFSLLKTLYLQRNNFSCPFSEELEPFLAKLDKCDLTGNSLCEEGCNVPDVCKTDACPDAHERSGLIVTIVLAGSLGIFLAILLILL
eukprot:TRINITY_DN4108_c0_g1_i1.p1 TRINITY_DN4108_c0_g1~~TRINITY_DN4108_c0_g1_i1.p1  ORF type:complete len:172 (-),score=28.82 TRINITY_DN4108_c0_g1_i1:47-562(-)